jgi:ribose 5-phosphate isomerase B
VRIAVGGDHAGYYLKSDVAAHLHEQGHEVIDFGTDSDDPVDYPLFCAEVGRAVIAGAVDFGIVFGGSGQGEQIAANKVHGVRAALCLDDEMARLARAHNNANVLALGGRILASYRARSIVDVFLRSTFEGGRHRRRVELIGRIEREECDGKRGDEGDEERHAPRIAGRGHSERTSR